MLNAVTFFGALIVVYKMPDTNPIKGTLMTSMIQAIIALSTMCVTFWVGSSSGSQKKDDATHPPPSPSGTST